MYLSTCPYPHHVSPFHLNFNCLICLFWSYFWVFLPEFNCCSCAHSALFCLHTPFFPLSPLDSEGRSLSSDWETVPRHHWNSLVADVTLVKDTHDPSSLLIKLCSSVTSFQVSRINKVVLLIWNYLSLNDDVIMIISYSCMLLWKQKDVSLNVIRLWTIIFLLLTKLLNL